MTIPDAGFRPPAPARSDTPADWQPARGAASVRRAGVSAGISQDRQSRVTWTSAMPLSPGGRRSRTTKLPASWACRN